jgi:hypothetical protein
MKFRISLFLLTLLSGGIVNLDSLCPSVGLPPRKCSQPHGARTSYDDASGRCRRCRWS